MDNPLLAALQSNYGDGNTPPPDTNTVRGLLEFCKMWLDQETETEDLNNPCMEMSARLKAGAKAQEDDLKQNPDLIDARRAPMARMAEAYWTIADILDRIPVMAAEDDVEGYEEVIGLFEEERQMVLDCNAEVEETLSGKIRLCPRCGDDAAGDLCTDCQLIPLFPDPRGAEFDPGKTAVLPPVYGQLNQAYDAVMSGVASLSTIYAPLSSFEKYLLELQNGYQQAVELTPNEGEDNSGFAEGQDLARRLLGELERSFEGVSRIRSVAESFSMADLSRGWDNIFNAGVDIQRATQSFAKMNGLLEDDGQSDSAQLGGG